MWLVHLCEYSYICGSDVASTVIRLVWLSGYSDMSGTLMWLVQLYWWYSDTVSTVICLVYSHGHSCIWVVL